MTKDLRLRIFRAAEAARLIRAAKGSFRVEPIVDDLLSDAELVNAAQHALTRDGFRSIVKRAVRLSTEVPDLSELLRPRQTEFDFAPTVLVDGEYIPYHTLLMPVLRAAIEERKARLQLKLARYRSRTAPDITEEKKNIERLEAYAEMMDPYYKKNPSVTLGQAAEADSDRPERKKPASQRQDASHRKERY